MNIFEEVFAKIEVQQKGKEGTDVWMVGEQLKGICRGDAHCAEIVLADLEIPEMGLFTAAKRIKEYADKQPRKGSCVCVPPDVAEGIIRKFYGLPEVGQEEQPRGNASGGMIDLEDFI